MPTLGRTPGAIITVRMMSGHLLKKTVDVIGWNGDAPTFFEIGFTDGSGITFDVDAPVPRLVYSPPDA